jgi:hypothetical protein
MLLLSSGAFEREIIEVGRCYHLLARFLAYLLQFVAENYEFATHSLGGRRCYSEARGDPVRAEMSFSSTSW